jgi:hypothetical protein
VWLPIERTEDVGSERPAFRADSGTIAAADRLSQSDDRQKARKCCIKNCGFFGKNGKVPRIEELWDVGKRALLHSCGTNLAGDSGRVRTELLQDHVTKLSRRFDPAPRRPSKCRSQRGLSGTMVPSRIFTFEIALVASRRTYVNTSTLANSQSPRPDFHRQVKRHNGLQN